MRGPAWGKTLCFGGCPGQNATVSQSSLPLSRPAGARPLTRLGIDLDGSNHEIRFVSSNGKNETFVQGGSILRVWNAPPQPNMRIRGTDCAYGLDIPQSPEYSRSVPVFRSSAIHTIVPVQQSRRGQTRTALATAIRTNVPIAHATIAPHGRGLFSSLESREESACPCRAHIPPSKQ